ncbi:Bro-N domain-containing protein, partial [Pseudomonas aeruginosa]
MNLIPYDFNSKQVQVLVDENGEPWFIAMEIAEILGYSDAYEMTKRLDDDEKQNRQIAGFGPRGASTINESGLYSAIISSNKPEAKPFKRWVTHDVLPSIRRTGSYSIG